MKKIQANIGFMSPRWLINEADYAQQPPPIKAGDDTATRDRKMVALDAHAERDAENSSLNFIRNHLMEQGWPLSAEDGNWRVLEYVALLLQGMTPADMKRLQGEGARE